MANKNKQTLEQQQIKASVKYVRVSPYKLRKVAKEISALPVNQALGKLNVMVQKSAKILYKLLHSGVANAVHNNQCQPEDLVIKSLIVNEGPKMKRYQSRARGRMFKILKPMSHVEMVLTTKESR